METKQGMVLRALAQGSLNRFEAERLGDHCLNSTVALLRDKGHLIYSRWERIPTRFDKSVRVKRYYLLLSQQDGQAQTNTTGG